LFNFSSDFKILFESSKTCLFVIDFIAVSLSQGDIHVRALCYFYLWRLLAGMTLACAGKTLPAREGDMPKRGTAHSKTTSEAVRGATQRQPHRVRAPQISNQASRSLFRAAVSSGPPRLLVASNLKRQRIEHLELFSAGIAHDFKNLLTIVSGNLEMLTADTADEEREVLTNEARKVVNLLAQTVTNLLTFARQEHTEVSVTDLGRVAEATRYVLKKLLGDGITIHIDGGIGLKAMINPAQLQTSLISLAINARDAMPKGGEFRIWIDKIYVSAAQAKKLGVKSGHSAAISVTDTGHGASKDVLDRAFEPFYTTKPGRGLGLGLASVRQFVKQIGGTIWIRSKPRHGTTVEFWIPLQHRRS
jgi:signal transduction histidine kinase